MKNCCWVQCAKELHSSDVGALTPNHWREREMPPAAFSTRPSPASDARSRVVALFAASAMSQRCTA